MSCISKRTMSFILIVRITGNSYINAMYDAVQVQNQRIRIFSGRTKHERMHDSTAEHIDILSNCLKKDWDSGREVMNAHLLRSKDATFDILLKHVNI